MAQRATANTINQKFKGKDILSIDQFSPQDIEKVFKVADKMKKLFESKKSSTLLSGRVVAAIFYEPSTRTFSSFTTAAKRLGAVTIEHQNPAQNSSAAKGETLEDTMKVLEAYADAIVLRHPESGSAARAAEAVNIPVLNAGDGPNQHPSQTLLDLYTIKNKFGRLNNLKTAFVGDPLHYRVFHGQVAALSKYKNNIFFGISPKGLEMPYEFRNKFYFDHVINMKELNKTLTEIKPDILSIGRIPKEYIKGNTTKYKFTITTETLKSLHKKTIIIHPLPRIDELSIEVDNDPRAVYFSDQIKNGLYIRMALISLVLGK